jgi:DNA transposition AAA+ family ATPase
MGVILIGMPGIEKRLARYPQLYSRIGFVHEYRPLSAAELTFVLQHHWATVGLKLSADDFTDAEAIAAVHRIASENFRLVQRLFAQITRVLDFPAGAPQPRRELWARLGGEVRGDGVERGPAN